MLLLLRRSLLPLHLHLSWLPLRLCPNPSTASLSIAPCSLDVLLCLMVLRLVLWLW